MLNVDQMIDEYSYGTASTHLRKAVDWISNNAGNVDLSEFKAPDFLGMPKDISKKLTHMDIDFIQLYGNDYVVNSSPSP